MQRLHTSMKCFIKDKIRFIMIAFQIRAENCSTLVLASIPLKLSVWQKRPVLFRKRITMPKVARDLNKTFEMHVTNNIQFKKRMTYDLSKIINKPFIDQITIMKGQGVPVKSIVEDFFKCSSVHGLQYFGKLPIKVSSYGKFAWACIMIASFICT